MQRIGKCALCGTTDLVADFGPKKEFICVACAEKDAERVMKEAVLRYGEQWVREVILEHYPTPSMTVH